MYRVRRQKDVPSLTSWTASIPEKGGVSTPLNLNFVDSSIVQFVGRVYIFFFEKTNFFFFVKN